MKRSRWLALLVWALLIEILTSWPNPPSVPAPEGSDKLVHLALYGSLGFLSMRAGWNDAGLRVQWKLTLVVLAAVAAFGALDEWHQQFIPGRSMDFGDWLADTGGAVAGILAYSLLAGARDVRREKPT